MVKMNRTRCAALLALLLPVTHLTAAVTPVRPTLAITTPAARTSETRTPVLSLAGTTHDNIPVTNVFYSATAFSGSSNAATSDAFARWSASVPLVPGTNVISAYAINTNGQVSTTNSITVLYAVTNALTIVKTGKGVVSPNDNGKPLVIGQSYTLHAMAEAGWRFTNWVVNYSGGATNFTTARLVFTMQSNLVIDVNFVDAIPPTLTLTPPTTIRGSNTVVSFSGKAHDNNRVGAVYYQVAGGPTNVAATSDAFTNWTATIVEPSGNYTVDVWAVDTNGNQSPVKTVKVDIDSAGFAPQSLSGFTLVTTPSGFQATSNYFGVNTYAEVSNRIFTAGNYTYTLTGANGASVVETALHPLNGQNTTQTWTLTFATVTSGTYTNANGDSGTFAIALAPAAAPAINGGAIIDGNDLDGYTFTSVLSDGSANRGDSQGNAATGIYTYAPISPDVALLMQNLSQSGTADTNYALLIFQSGAAGTNLYFTEEDTTGGYNSDSGVFALATNGVVGKTPASLAGLTATVTQVGTGGASESFMVSFDAATFGQFVNKTNGSTGVGNYTLTPTAATTANLDLEFIAPPAAASNGSSVMALTFSRTNVAKFTSGSGHGTVTFHHAAVTAPVSLNGESLVLQTRGGGATIYQFNDGLAQLSFRAPPGGAASTVVVSPEPYTYAAFGPQSALVTINGTTNSTEITLWFTTQKTGRYLNGPAINTFTLK